MQKCCSALLLLLQQLSTTYKSKTARNDNHGFARKLALEIRPHNGSKMAQQQSQYTLGIDADKSSISKQPEKTIPCH